MLQAVEENSIEMKLACSMLDEKLENLESILALKKREKKQWCSSKAREITIGRARRGRVKAATLSNFQKGVLEKSLIRIKNYRNNIFTKVYLSSKKPTKSPKLLFDLIMDQLFLVLQHQKGSHSLFLQGLLQYLRLLF